MSEAFDPYYKWLGIRPEEQPANHYRLLGIALWESDADVIDGAADQRMAHLRSFQTGRHAPLSQRLLSEVAAARVCLLDPQKKAVYDEQLRRTLATMAQPQGSSTSFASGVELPTLTVHSGGARPATVRKRASSQTVPLVLGATGALIFVLGIGAMILILGRQSSKVVAKSELQPLPSRTAPSPKVPPPAPASKAVPKTIADTEESSPSAGIESSSSIATDKHPAAGTVSRPPPGESSATGQGKSEDPPAIIEAESKPATSVPEPATSKDVQASSSNAKVPIPADEARSDANKRIRAIFGIELEAPRTLSQKQELAAKLAQTARETQNDLPGQFVLLGLARDLAAAAGDTTLALDLVDQIAAVFQVDSWRMKSDTMAALSKQAKTAGQHQELAERLLELMESAATIDRFDIAREVGQLGLDSAAKVRDPLLLKRARQRVTDVEVVAKGFEDTTSARATLEEDASDPEANQKVGTYLSLVKGDWTSGLRLLAKGSDLSLKVLAQRDLEGPSSVEDRIKLGDDWWNLAQTKSAGVQKQLRDRAIHWYKAALPELVGSAKDRVLHRIALAIPATRIEFRSPQVLSQFVLAEAPGRSWKIKGGSLYIGGDAAYTTLRTYFKAISSVTIRGGIEAPDGRNFRVAVGALNMILNWELADQNHYRLGENAPPPTVTEPRALVPAKLQEIQILQQGENVVVKVNGKQEYSVTGTLDGTLTIYPHGSTIVIQEIVIAGEADPTKSVTSASHQNLY